jgi:hypothetical protein
MTGMWLTRSMVEPSTSFCAGEMGSLMKCHEP